ncbi:MAG: hypothetical protein PHC53_02465 [Patescibacteria group bacterium]|nr:hypothetical protein [Patescibacteria group bacterium]
MKNVTAIIICLFICLLSTAALAQIKVKVATGQVWSTVLHDGEPKAGAAATTLGLALTVPMSQSWLWYAEGGLATPNSSFYPSPRTVQGPAYKLTSTVSLGVTGVYQYSPKHGHVDWSHMAGAGLFVGVNITKEIGLTLVAGCGKGLREGGLWSVSVQPRISFTLPF